MSEEVKPLDVYSTHTIPFAIAAWCRQHRFNPRAVKLAKAIAAFTETQTQIGRLETQHASQYADIRSLVKQIENEDARQAELAARIPEEEPRRVAYRVPKAA